VSRVLRVGLVGCGRVAERGYVPALRRASGVRLAAVADPDLERCERLAPGLPAYDGAAALLDAGAADALVLATPAETHLEDAGLAAARGVPTLVEKPPAPDAAAAAALARLDPPPWIAFNRRFDPQTRRLRSALPAGVPLELRLDLHYPADTWQAYTVVDDALLALGTHLIDLARWLARSDVVSVRSAAVEDRRASFELELVRGRARISCGRETKRLDVVEALDERGNRLARRTARRTREAARRLARPGAPNSLVALFVAELEAFARAAAGDGESPLATAADGAAVMQALEAVRRSARAGGAVCPV
jgi:predicted dehydrogenase